jgi:hypothetical protein
MRKRSLTKRRKHRRHIKNRRNKTRIKKSKTKTKKRKKRSRKKRPKYIKNVLKGGASCLCPEEVHGETISKINDALLARGASNSVCIAESAGGHGGGGGCDRIVKWYIVGHGAWKQNWVDEEEEVAKKFEGWLTTSEYMKNNLKMYPSLANKTYIVLHTKLGQVMLQTAISNIITGEDIPNGPYNAPASSQVPGRSLWRLPCFEEEIRIYPTKSNDLMARDGASSGLYYDGNKNRGVVGEREEGKINNTNNICRDMRIMGTDISIHHFISEIMKKVTNNCESDGKGVGNVTLYIHLLCCLAPLD